MNSYEISKTELLGVHALESSVNFDMYAFAIPRPLCFHYFVDLHFVMIVDFQAVVVAVAVVAVVEVAVVVVVIAVAAAVAVAALLVLTIAVAILAQCAPHGAAERHEPCGAAGGRAWATRRADAESDGTCSAGFQVG